MKFIERQFFIRRAWVCVLAWMLAVTFATPGRAIGPLLLPTSFEELVHDSTDIVIGRVVSTAKAKEPGNEFFFRRKATVEIVRILKGNLSAKTIVVDHEVTYPTVDVTVAEGHTYLLFLGRGKGANSFDYERPDWACWEVSGDQLVNHRPAIDEATTVPMAGFLQAIAAERRRPPKPLVRSFSGISIGTSLQEASQSSGMTFSKYIQRGDDANWERYYAMPKDRSEYLVTLALYKSKLLYLEIYYLKDGTAWSGVVRQMESMAGGTPLGQFGNLSFRMGRMWKNQNVQVRLEEVSFAKDQRCPWGAFSAYEVWVTDQHVLSEYLADNAESVRHK